jgi:nucleoside-diphosphate-sugar epimerase
MAPLPAEDLEHVLTHAAAAFAALRGARLLVTGGTGFIGRWLLESLVRANDRFSLGVRATVLTRAPEAVAQRAPELAAHPALTWQRGDVRGLVSQGERFTHIVHAATPASAALNAAQPLEMLDVIVGGTRAALEVARASPGASFLLVSSGLVLGPQPPDVTHVAEDHPGAPAPGDAGGAYAHGKRLAEHLCALYHAQHGVAAKIGRGFAFVGPLLPLDAHFAVGNFIRDCLNGGPIRVAGDGTPRRSYLYAADLAVWLWTILVAGAPCRPYHVGAEDDLAIRELATEVAAAAVAAGVCRAAPAVVIAQAPRPGPASRYVPSTARARSELGLVERIPRHEALARTLAFAARHERAQP